MMVSSWLPTTTVQCSIKQGAALKCHEVCCVLKTHLQAGNVEQGVPEVRDGVVVPSS